MNLADLLPVDATPLTMETSRVNEEKLHMEAEVCGDVW